MFHQMEVQTLSGIGEPRLQATPHYSPAPPYIIDDKPTISLRTLQCRLRDRPGNICFRLVMLTSLLSASNLTQVDLLTQQQQPIRPTLSSILQS
jgi:hypothetical protein